jgi:3-deoxy-D-manno-octulosonic-acid transferase
VAALLAVLGAPAALAGLAVRPSWRTGWRERLGSAPGSARGAIWIHCASVGESLAALRIVDRLAAGSIPVCVSTGTVTGRAVVRGKRPGVPSSLAPLDHPWCVEAALARVEPCALVLVETELWPTWIRAARARGIPVLVVSGRLSDRSFSRYRRLRSLTARTLRRLSAVGARTPLDAERFVALGARPEVVSVTGDLKLEPPERTPELAADLDTMLGRTPLVVGGSTHAGEEDALFTVLEATEQAGHPVALVLAPRHPERAERVERRARELGRVVRRRSTGDKAPLAAGEVLVLDTVGELVAVYRRAAVAFVGGSLAPVGGHNLLEPVFAGRPVLFGPHTANQRAAAELLLGCDAGRRVSDPQQLARAALDALEEPGAGADRARRGRERLERHRGTAERTAALVREWAARSRPIED